MKADQVTKQIPWETLQSEDPKWVVICIFARSTSHIYVCQAQTATYWKSHTKAKLTTPAK